jgi:5-methylcytosine-specific restriction protein B
MAAVTSIVRIYDLAKELKIDTKRLIEEVRREGVDVSVPSNSISKELAEKIRNKYFPKKDTSVKRAIKIVKKAVRPVTIIEDAPSGAGTETGFDRIGYSPIPQTPPSRVVRKLSPALRAKSAPTTPSQQVRLLHPTAAALNAGIRRGEPTPAPTPTTSSTQETWSSEAEREFKESQENYGLLWTIEKDDKMLQSVGELIEDYAGVVLTGPPGTSKTWYADQIAAALVEGDPGRVRFVQFHSSYQYEDFVEGYVPRKDGNGFELKKKHLLEMCDTARLYDGRLCVMVVDELSRSDPARVFGEALTYIEPTKRNQTFHLSSGNTASIPPNLVFIATMNPMDRGVEEVDAALERRFAKIAMDPSVVILENMLDKNGVETGLKRSILTFFQFLLGNSNERCRVGHAYFRSVRNDADLRRLWDHQLRFHMAKAFLLNSDGYRSIEREWKRMFPAASTPVTRSKNPQDPEPRW